MKKIKILSIIVIAIVGCYLIYYHFINKEQSVNVPNKIINDYSLIENNDLFEAKSIDEINHILTHNTGIVFICTPTSSWCQYYALYLYETAKENNIDKIYYLDVKEERVLDSNKYHKLLTILDEYLYYDDTGSKRLYMPNLTIVKDGTILANDNETSNIIDNTPTEEYWTIENITNFKNKLNNYINLLNIENETEEY